MSTSGEAILKTFDRLLEAEGKKVRAKFCAESMHPHPS
jgi:hypothetical protein